MGHAQGNTEWTTRPALPGALPAAPWGPVATYTFLFSTTPSRTKAARAFFCTSEDNTS